MKYHQLHRLRICQTFARYGNLRFAQLRTRWLDICDSWVTPESFQGLLDELEEESILSFQNEIYALTEEGQEWLAEQGAAD